MQEDVAHTVGIAAQVGTPLSDEVAASRTAAQQADAQAPPSGARTDMQQCGSMPASSGSLSDSLPEHSIADLMRRPASAPAAAVQTSPLQHRRHHAGVQSAAVAEHAPMQHPQAVAGLPSAVGQDAAGQTPQQAPAAAQDTAAQVTHLPGTESSTDSGCSDQGQKCDMHAPV